MSDTKPWLLSQGVALISNERYRQQTQEGYTAEDDAQYTDGELLRAASAYLAAALNPERSDYFGALVWPWHRHSFKPSDDPVRTLAKAGALIAAEIDRLQVETCRRSIEIDTGGRMTTEGRFGAFVVTRAAWSVEQLKGDVAKRCAQIAALNGNRLAARSILDEFEITDEVEA